MHPCFIYNNEMMGAPKVRPEAFLLYGRGVFTTLAIHHHQPFLWKEHWARLRQHGARLGFNKIDFDEATVKALLARLIKANKVKEGRARVTLTTTTERGIWNIEGNFGRETELHIMTGDAHIASEDGLALTISPYRVNTLSPLIGIKSVNYLDHILACEEARARDFDEAVSLNERGEIVSASMANIFWVTNGTLHTPALTTGALAGTTRACVIELAGALSIPHVEGVYELSDLGDADEIFLTSAGHGISIVTTFDFHRYTVAVGSVALRLREAFRQFTLQSEE